MRSTLCLCIRSCLFICLHIRPQFLRLSKFMSSLCSLCVPFLIVGFICGPCHMKGEQANCFNLKFCVYYENILVPVCICVPLIFQAHEIALLTVCSPPIIFRPAVCLCPPLQFLSFSMRPLPCKRNLDHQFLTLLVLTL